jgi:DNA-binding LytR/AlgR family response regulator
MLRGHTGAPLRIAARRQRSIVFLELDEVWACEAADRLTYVHSARGRYDLDLTLAAIAASFGPAMLRVHRNWLVNTGRVLELEREAGEVSLFAGSAKGANTVGVRIPIAKERAAEVRMRLLAVAPGIRHG